MERQMYVLTVTPELHAEGNQEHVGNDVIEPCAGARVVHAQLRHTWGALGILGQMQGCFTS